MPPIGWGGSDPGFYQSFDYSLILWEGTVQMCGAQLVSRKVMITVYQVMVLMIFLMSTKRALYVVLINRNLILMSKTDKLANYFYFLVKVNSALTLDHTKRQWVDLGFHTEDCMTQPETCGAAGGAISMRMRLIDCPTGGIITSMIHQDH